MSLIYLSEQDVKERRELVQRLANELREKHHVEGVLVAFFEERDTPFAIAVAPENAKPILKAIPRHLREMAEKAAVHVRELLGRS